jgi:hypothetical protein
LKRRVAHSPAPTMASATAAIRARDASAVRTISRQ